MKFRVGDRYFDVHLVKVCTFCEVVSFWFSNQLDLFCSRCGSSKSSYGARIPDDRLERIKELSETWGGHAAYQYAKEVIDETKR